MAEAHASRGAAFGDFDNDGDIDVVVWNRNEPPSLLRNDLKGGNHWLQVKLTGTKSNRAAIGATVTVESGGHSQARVGDEPGELHVRQRSAAAFRPGQIGRRQGDGALAIRRRADRRCGCSGSRPGDYREVIQPREREADISGGIKRTAGRVLYSAL